MIIKANVHENSFVEVHKMDTKAADKYLNKFFDDSRFLERDKDYDTLPQIAEDIDDIFKKIYKLLSGYNI